MKTIQSGASQEFLLDLLIFSQTAASLIMVFNYGLYDA